MSETQDPFEVAEAASKDDKMKFIHQFLSQNPQVMRGLADGKLCAMCLNEITPEQADDPDATYREATSWVTGKKSQSPVLREQSGRRAHRDCIEKLINGQAPDQERIPGLEDT